MATSDKEQQGIDVKYHTRLAQGAKLDGTSLQAKGGKEHSESKKMGGLAHHSGKKSKWSNNSFIEWKFDKQSYR